MQLNKNGIMVDIPGLRKRTTKIIQKPRNDFTRYKTFATMIGYENGCNVTATVPVAHDDFKKLKQQGYKVVEVWEKGEIA